MHKLLFRKWFSCHPGQMHNNNYLQGQRSNKLHRLMVVYIRLEQLMQKNLHVSLEGGDAGIDLSVARRCCSANKNMCFEQ